MRLKPDPIGEPRNSLAVFLLIMSFVSGALFLVGVPSSGGIEAELPRAASLTWGAVLAFGSGCVLLGMFWQGDRRTGLLLKRTGFLALVVASGVYSATLVLLIGVRALLSASVVLGYGWACAHQWRRVNRTVIRIVRLTVRVHDGEG